ncbi:MAG: serine/threonine protein phosphatase [Clostridiales bacterium]|nr:serine/threonine protein phosphatase [Clostridiales bacterium]
MIADLHLGLSVDKPMDIFGPGWEQHERRLRENWCARVRAEDTVFVPGDISWGMDLEQAMADLRYLSQLPGTKILSKGNHDYWWGTVGKMEAALERQGIWNIHFLHNNAYLVENKIFCGSKGYLRDGEESDAQNQKLMEREAQRFAHSVREGLALRERAGEALELIALFHYPPVTPQQRNEGILALLRRHGIGRCYYGHIHGMGTRTAITGPFEGVELSLVSADFLSFVPKIIE